MGRNRMCFFDVLMQAGVLAREALIQELRRGLAAAEFVLFYQVQVDARGQALGAEALLRWQHPSRGLLLPAQFMSLAEASALILPLGQWVLAAACKQLLAWAQAPQTAGWTLAVNISAAQLAQADFADTVARTLQASGAPADRLILELTELALLNDVEDVLRKMQTLTALGVGFCLDDFGAGFASLTWLRRLPLVQLKIDQLMVREVLSDASVAVIARAILALGASLGVSVTVEGVESAAQRDFFAAIGCRAFQGQFIGAVAMPGEMLQTYLASQPLELLGQSA
jgi:EAL domain-containing protein (putative c-di-GMP-specific phosphodiesterase class I)